MLLEKICTPTILVMDAMEFRRAGVLCSLEAWAASIGATAMGVAPANFEEEMPDEADIVLVVLSLGGLPLASEDAQRWLGQIRTVLPGRPVAILSDIETPDEAAAAFQAGAQGLLPTSLKPSVVLHALAFIQAGGTYFSPAALLKPAAALHHPAAGGKWPSTAEGEADGLTPRQQEVLNFLQLGRSNKLIARALDMQESTVKVHVRQIMRKLGAANRTQAALMAAKAHLEKADGTTRAQPAENGAAASPMLNGPFH